MQPSEVLPTMARHMIVDGFDFVLDHERSQGSILVDARDGTEYLDMFTFFASNALGMNHPDLLKDEVRDHLACIAVNKPSNSDVYSAEIAAFADVFTRVLGDDRLRHLFLIEGGALAVENALKAAFDWKSQLNERAGRDPALGSKVMHLTGAFHGRTGYTMSLTNTDPQKVARYPKFHWPRIDAPYLQFPLDAHGAANRRREDEALSQARAALEADGHDIACFLAEPVQSEGGDRHISPRFLQEVAELCREHDVLFAVDEVQTGVGLTGTNWCYEQLGIEPDLVAFGKKTHVCGVMAGGRIDELEDNVFVTPSRLNSTFGGNLVDITRMTYVLEVIDRDELVERAATLGDHLQDRLVDLESRHGSVTNARGRGLLCAFDLPDGAARDRVLTAMREDEHVFLIGCGDRSVRFRPALTVTESELDQAVDALDRVLERRTG